MTIIGSKPVTIAWCHMAQGLCQQMWSPTLSSVSSLIISFVHLASLHVVLMVFEHLISLRFSSFWRHVIHLTLVTNPYLSTCVTSRLFSSLWQYSWLSVSLRRTISTTADRTVFSSSSCSSENSCLCLFISPNVLIFLCKYFFVSFEKVIHLVY